MKRYFPILFIILLFLTSCGNNPEKLLQEGKPKEALKLYKKILVTDYKNSRIRRKIATIYFDLAKKYIEQEDLEKAEREIERAMIYADENDAFVKNEYAGILKTIGNRYIKNNYSGGIKDEMIINHKKYLQKGIELTQKSVALGNKDAQKILNNLNQNFADAYYKRGVEELDRWSENPRRTNLLIQSKNDILRSKEMNCKKKDIASLLNRIKEKMLTIADRTVPYSISIQDPIFYNNGTRKVAFKIRFYNNVKKGFRAVGPKQFTLYDSKGRKYKPYFDKEPLEGYKGLFLRRRVDAQRSSKGLLVFNLGKRITRFNKLVWVSSKGETAVKYFPNKDIRKIDLK